VRTISSSLGLGPVLLATTLGLTQCAHSEDDAAQPPSPPADRELWQARLEMHGSASSVIITAPYVQDFLDDQVTRAEGGISIGFLDSSHRTVSRIEAERLSLSFRDDRVRVAGSVVVESGDSAVVRTDTLVWHSDTDLLEAPERVRLETPSGWVEGNDLRTGPGMAEWTLSAPRGVWRAEPDTGAMELEIRGRQVTGQQADGYSEAEYDSVAIQLSDQHVVAGRGWYEGRGGGRLRLADGVAIRDSIRSLIAQVVEWDLEMGTAQAHGAVELVEEKLHLRADQLGEEEGGDRWQARGAPVRVELGDRVLEARVLKSRRQEQSLSCQQAVLRDGERVLRADTIEYARNHETARARGGVRLDVPAFEGTATAGTMAVDLQRDRAELGQSPALTRALSDGGDLTIAANHMVLELGARVLTGTGEFSVTSGQTAVVAGSGRFESETDLATLAGQVEFRQSAGSARLRSHIRADTMVAEFADGRLMRVGVPAGLEGSVGGEASRMTWVLADSGAISLNGDRLVRLDLTGSGDVTHQNQIRNTASRFRADTMALSFSGDDELRRVWASGKAELTALLAPADTAASAPPRGPAQGRPEAAGGGARAYNRVRGEELEIDLVDGEVTQVRVLKSIEGRYVPPGAREPSGADQTKEDEDVADR